MSRVKELQAEISNLSEREFAELRDWLVERDWKTWDEQFEADVNAGKLDRLADEALRRHAGGHSTPL
ncbi:MAG: hypothetical protein HY961_04230 [Ignavibacteriae bacterium]|nr:hypothetical protein [Ignavibacteriota bacterium]